MHHFISRSLVGSLGFLVVFMTTISNANAATIQQWVAATNELRIAAKQQGEITPYRQDQYKALKAYFSEMNGFANDLKESTNYAWQFNNALSWSDMSDQCSKLFFKKADWQNVLQRCTRNDFFLCAEEVKTYPETVSAIRDMLIAKQQKRFDETPSCQAAL